MAEQKRRPDKGAATRLKAVQQETDGRALRDALSDPSGLVVEAAAKRIKLLLERMEIPAAGMASGLVAAYHRLHREGTEADSGCWGRMAIVEALGTLTGPEGEAVAFLAARTVQVEVVSFGPQDSGIGLRAAGALMLANLRPPGALLDLGALLFDTSNNGGADARHKAPVRQAAAKAIGQLGDPAGAALLAVKLAGAGAAYGLADVAGHPGLKDDEEILGECMDGLVALQEPRTLELLAPWLGAPDPYLVATAATGIAQVGKAAAVPLLVGALDVAPLAAKEPLVYALAAVRADEGRAALAQLAEGADPVVRRLARELL